MWHSVLPTLSSIRVWVPGRSKRSTTTYNEYRVSMDRRLIAKSLFSFGALAVLNGCALTSWFTSTRSEFVPPDPAGLDARLQSEGAEPNGQVDHFAVMIGADTELRHRGNLSMA